MNAPMQPLGREAFSTWARPPLWGMIHLAPLPGSPGYEGDSEAPLRRAVEDADALHAAGFAAVMVENYGDVPFYAERVPPVTVAALSRAAAAIVDRHPELHVGINCLRNDAHAALSIAAAVGAAAIRVNVHVGTSLTDQGRIDGRAAETLRLRRELGSTARIFADLRVKHAAPLGVRSLEEEAEDLRHRGLADAILITGAGTGKPADPSMVAGLRAVLPDTPLLVASGVDQNNANSWARIVDGAIVGSALMRGGRAGAGVDPERAASILQAWEAG